MNIQELTKEELREIPMVEIAFEVMKDAGKPFNYYDLFKVVADLKGVTPSEVEARISKLYTDINIDGRFHSLGDNQWGLKRWYPLEQTEEEITTPVKKRKRPQDIEDEEDVDFDDYEEDYDELDPELEEIEDEEELEEDELEYDEKDDLDELEEEELEDEEFEEDEELE